MCKPLPIGINEAIFPSVHTHFDLEMQCSCRRYIFEQDSLYCDVCGDVCCDSCRVQCFHCGQFICQNCAHSSYECLKCTMGKGNFVNEVFIMINGVKTKVTNGGEFIAIIDRAKVLGEKVTLDLSGIKYELDYATYFQQEYSKLFDYIAVMKEVV